MTDNDRVAEEIKDFISTQIALLSLEDAMDVMEKVQTDVDTTVNGLDQDYANRERRAGR